MHILFFVYYGLHFFQKKTEYNQVFHIAFQYILTFPVLLVMYVKHVTQINYGYTICVLIPNNDSGYLYSEGTNSIVSVTVTNACYCSVIFLLYSCFIILLKLNMSTRYFKLWWNTEQFIFYFKRNWNKGATLYLCIFPLQ